MCYTCPINIKFTYLLKHKSKKVFSFGKYHSLGYTSTVKVHIYVSDKLQVKKNNFPLMEDIAFEHCKLHFTNYPGIPINKENFTFSILGEVKEEYFSTAICNEDEYYNFYCFKKKSNEENESNSKEITYSLLKDSYRELHGF
jgi:hypothetical protein